MSRGFVKVIFSGALLICIGCGRSWADETFTVQGKSLDFYREKKTKALLSRSCFTGEVSAPKCEAWTALARATLKGFDEKFARAGAQPASWICDVKVDGRAVLAMDAHKNENYFCRFKDGSMLSLGALTEAAHRNDAP